MNGKNRLTRKPELIAIPISPITIPKYIGFRVKLKIPLVCNFSGLASGLIGVLVFLNNRLAANAINTPAMNRITPIRLYGYCMLLSLNTTIDRSMIPMNILYNWGGDIPKFLPVFI